MSGKTLGLLLFLLIASLFPCVARAHPMGNFSVNHYSKISVQGDGIKLRYIIDLAEIPTYQELQQGNITAAPQDPATLHFVAQRGAELGSGLVLSLDGKPLTLHLRSSSVIFPPGAGGLPTMKMGFVYEAAFPADADRTRATFHYADTNYVGHTGWKEIIAVAVAGKLLRSSVPESDRSAELNNYPTDFLSSPPQDLEASIDAILSAPPTAAPLPLIPHTASQTAATRTVPQGTSVRAFEPIHPDLSHSQPVAKPVAPIIPAVLTPALALKANQQLTPRSSFTELITAQHLSPWFFFTAALIAIGLGALHALEPGHGKTIVAAYLVGSRGTARHAVLLGLIVTASHTAGVFALGAITLYASRYIVPEQLYPWLGVLSGLTIAVLGCYMLLRRLTGTATDHDHTQPGSRAHWFSFNRVSGDAPDADRPAAQQAINRTVSMGQLFTLGITGGIIPCPAALIVLLSAFALHRVALGFFLIVAFGLGLAAVLIGFGMMMVYARRFMTHLQIDGPLTKRWLPVASATFITILGTVITVQAFAATHLNVHIFSKERLGPLLFVTGLGLILGMRHSTDADHVVAISTIVSKQRSIRGAAFIGSIWGLGHTITIFIVGSLIILFGVVIPPRVGLSMEFSVAIMLILLGILNLTGVMQKLTTRFTPSARSQIQTSDPELAEALTAAPGKRGFGSSVHSLGVYQTIRPLAIGLVHGLAGSAAVALLVLSTIHDPRWATLYLLVFGAGTMVGMMCMTAAMAVPLTYAGDRFTNLSRYMGVASGMVSLCFGVFLVYQLGFVGGLFTSHPQWTPH